MAKKKQVEVPPLVEPVVEVVVVPVPAPAPIAPTAPGQTGTAPLTRPQRRDERRWQQ